MSLTKNDFDSWAKQYFPYFKILELSSTQDVIALQYNKDALHYILKDVLDLGSNSQIAKSVISFGTTTVSELLQITIEDITNLQYYHGNSGMVKI